MFICWTEHLVISFASAVMINDLEEGAECTLFRFAGEIMLFGGIDLLQGRKAPPSDLDRLDQ